MNKEITHAFDMAKEKLAKYYFVGNALNAPYQLQDLGWMQDFDNYVTLALPPNSDEVFEVHGAICKAWYEIGRTEKIGWPISNEYDYDDKGNKISDFQNGSILWYSDSNQVDDIIFNKTERVLADVVQTIGKGVVVLSKTAAKIGKMPMNYINEQRKKREYERYVAERIKARDPNFVITYEEYQESISGQNDW